MKRENSNTMDYLFIYLFQGKLVFIIIILDLGNLGRQVRKKIFLMRHIPN